MNDSHPIFRGGTFAIMTADRPTAQSAGGNEALRGTLNSMGLRHEPIRGKWDGLHENGFVIHDIPEEQARHLGRLFGQTAIIHSTGGDHRLVYTTGEHEGKHQPLHPTMSPITQFDTEPDDNWSQLPGGKHFRINFNWDTPPQADVPVAKALESLVAMAVRLKRTTPQRHQMGLRNPHETLKSPVKKNETIYRAGEAMTEKTYSPEEAASILKEAAKSKLNEHAEALRDLKKAELQKRIAAPHIHETGMSAASGSEDVAPAIANPPGKNDPMKKEELCKRCGKACLNKCGDMEKSDLVDSKGKRSDNHTHPESVTPDDKKSKEVRAPTKDDPGSGGIILPGAKLKKSIDKVIVHGKRPATSIPAKFREYKEKLGAKTTTYEAKEAPKKEAPKPVEKADFGRDVAVDKARAKVQGAHDAGEQAKQKQALLADIAAHPETKVQGQKALAGWKAGDLKKKP